MFLIFEHMDSSLSNFIMDQVRAGKFIPRLQIKHIFRQIVQGLSHLHRNLIMHRDLKSGNILIDQTSHHVKIADLGLSTHFNLPFSNYSTKVSKFGV